MKKRFNWKIFLISFGIVILTALIGSSVTSTQGWYESIKPSITPPNFVFPIAWTILFIMIAFSFYFSWTNAKKQKAKIISLFVINLILNALWSILFFRMKKPAFAFVDIILLLVSILTLIIFTYKIDKKSSYLLMPYFLWVSFASYLNYLIAF